MSDNESGKLLEWIYHNAEEMSELFEVMAERSKELTEKLISIAKESSEMYKKFKHLETSYKKVSIRIPDDALLEDNLTNSEKNKIISDNAETLSSLTFSISEGYKNMSERLRKLSMEISEHSKDMSNECIEISLMFKKDSNYHKAISEKFRKKK